MYRTSVTLVNLLIFTIISSVVAYHLVIKAYDIFDSSESAGSTVK